MRRRVLWIALVVVCGSEPTRAQIGGCVPDETDPIVVEVVTNLGTIPIELFPNTAPNTVQNFLNYMDDGDYDGVIFHRSVRGFVVQAGGFREGVGDYQAIPTDPSIPNEPCLSNTQGTIAMARLGGQPHSATSQWFINVVDNPGLDLADGVGFTAFGRVTPAGMLVVNDIESRPIFDALAYLERSMNQVMRELPLQTLPVESPSWGCSRADPTYGLASEVSETVILDPLRSGSTGDVVPILLDPTCDGSGAQGPPSVPCTVGVGRDVFLVDLPKQERGELRIPMTCDAVAESEASWAARRAGTIPQLFADDIEIASVPEPSGALVQVSCALTLLLLSRRGRGRR